MLSKTELKILELLFDDLTKEYTIREIALTSKLPYPQVHRSITSLFNKNLIKEKEQGKSIIINLVLESVNDDYVSVELERKKKIAEHYKLIKMLVNDLEKMKYTLFICILFGSYAQKKARTDSDIDILFIIPDEYDYEQFEKFAKQAIFTPKADINITTEKGVMELWNNPLKLNVGNEVLKKHIVLSGAEHFLKLRRKHYIG